MSDDRKTNNQGWWVALGLTALVSYNMGSASAEKDARSDYAASIDQAAADTNAAADAARAAAAEMRKADRFAASEPEPETFRPIALMSEPVGGDVYYANCSAARAAGDTPLYEGDPGYARRMDRDGDGVACE